MVTTTLTATVDPDGSIRLPAGTAPPGMVVTVVIETPQPTPGPGPHPIDDEGQPLTRLTATTPEKREELIQWWLRYGQSIRDQLTEEQLWESEEDWLYDENGLPR